MSNPIPDQVMQYAKLHHRKKELNAETTKLNQELKALHEFLVENMKKMPEPIFEICPTTEDEVNEWGSVGVVKLREKSEYEAITKDTLIDSGQRFFRYIFPQDTDDDQVKKSGRGLGEWIWKNRRKTSKFVVERVYEGARAQKRKSSSGGTEPQVKLAKKVSPGLKVPTTQADFLSIPAFQAMRG